jgi:phosphatidylinositol kinase/protein kinase (PI-3  family)
VFRDFPTLSRIYIFFLLTLSLLLFSLLIFSLLSASALLCFSSVHIVGSLTSKLPSIFFNINPSTAPPRHLFLSEIGAEDNSTATFEAVAAALEAELLLPLRALNEWPAGADHDRGAIAGGGPGMEMGGWGLSIRIELVWFERLFEYVCAVIICS